MSELIDAPVQGEAGEGCGKAHGSHIWYELITSNAEGAKRFYNAVTGWDIGPPHDEIGYRMIGRSDGGNAGGVLPLSEDMTQHGAKPMWAGYINVDDVDRTVADVEAKGGHVFMPARQIDEVGRIAMVADPQGNAFYVMTPTPSPDDPDAKSDVFSPTEVQRVGWNELSTTDPAAARDFYGELFGWTSEEFMPMGEFGDYRFFDHGGQRIGAVCGVMPGGSAGWRYYIRVPSITKAVEAVKAGGGSVSMGPHEVPGGDHIIIGNDPQGAEFALVGKA
jgi:predicted enzyme related to lactoylglutathione lyase